MRAAGIAYVAYFVLAIMGAATASAPLSVLGTAVYFVLAIFLYRSFWRADRGIALALLPLAAIGCVIQAVGIIEADREVQRLALLFFGLFLVVLGYLVARSMSAPRRLGYALALAGLGWCALMIPGLPGAAVVGVMIFGAVAEIVFAAWLLVAS